MEDQEERAAAPRRRNKLLSVCSFILVVEMCERLCYYTLQGSQRNYLEDSGRGGATRGMQASVAFSVSACWSMVSYMSCMLGGYLADNRLGRYRTILYFAVVYLLGVALVALAAVPSIMASAGGVPLYLLGAFVFVALGTGAIKPNVMNFGADQYDTEDAEELVQQKAFFSYFYLTINIGVVFAMGFTVNLATSGSSEASAGTGYLKAYCIAAGAMLIALLCFALGTPRYVAKGRVARRPMLRVLAAHLRRAAQRHGKGKLCVLAWMLIPIYMIIVLCGSLLGSFPRISQSMTWLAMVLALLSCSLLVLLHRRNDFVEAPDGFLEDSGASADASPAAISTADVRGALDCVPTIICINVGFNILYNAMNNAYPAQACQMDTRLFGEQLNGSFFSLGDAFGIILLVPLYEKVIFPAIYRYRGYHLNRSTKYVLGFFCATLANLSAALLEHLRRSSSTGVSPDFVPCPEELLFTSSCSNGFLLSKCSPGASLPMTRMSAFWMAIPMFLTGAGEILVNPVVYQYVFEEAPPPLRSILQALNLVAAGSISNAMTAALSPLVPENLNEGHLVYFYYVNCLLALVALVVFLYLPEHGLSRPPELGLRTSLLATQDRSASLLGSVQIS
ncbi:unnamed protein product [Durusdinium trenchii]|uniref:Protein NRT1/ PTR FAMILY 8.2 (AtNPF8.2) (Peptide transporter PTR5) n=2 Tax=Durusdinium trenchii TaxID=1381693 RepID=A0ABP0NW60_9DINO